MASLIQDSDNTEIKLLSEKGITFKTEDITKESYDMLRRKREVAIRYEDIFKEENNEEWLQLLVSQTDYVKVSFEVFSQKMARYIFVIN